MAKPFSESITLLGDADAYALYAILKEHWRGFAEQGKPLQVTIEEKPSERSKDQNRLLHWYLQRIADNAWVDGKQYEMLTWKEYFKGKFIGYEDVLLPDGRVIQQAISTTTLSLEDFSDFITKIECYSVSHDGLGLDARIFC